MPARSTRPRGRPRRTDSAPAAGAGHAGRADAEATAAVAILDAAERLFAEQGFAATTVKQVGDAARVNPALLYYYFGDKERLYRAVIRRLIGGLVVEGMEQVLATLPPQEAVTRLVQFQVKFLSAHPNAPRLMAREFADHQAARAEDAIARLAATLFARLCDAVRAGQESGEFRDDLDPRFAAISTIAQVVYLFIARPAVGILLGHPTRQVPDEEIAAFGRHAVRFALAALASPATDAPDGNVASTTRSSRSAPARRRSR